MRERSTTVKQETKENHPYQIWFGPGVQVFSLDPDNNQRYQNGQIPENSRILVQVTEWPKYRSGYQAVRVVELDLRGTTPSKLIRFQPFVKGIGLSVGGFIINDGDFIFIPRGQFPFNKPALNPKSTPPKNGPRQLPLL